MFNKKKIKKKEVPSSASWRKHHRLTSSTAAMAAYQKAGLKHSREEVGSWILWKLQVRFALFTTGSDKKKKKILSGVKDGAAAMHARLKQLWAGATTIMLVETTLKIWNLAGTEMLVVFSELKLRQRWNAEPSLQYLCGGGQLQSGKGVCQTHQRLYIHKNPCLVVTIIIKKSTCLNMNFISLLSHG